MIVWQWHQLYHMQVICISLQTDNHASTSVFTGRMPFLLPNQQHQSTEGSRAQLYAHIYEQFLQLTVGLCFGLLLVCFFAIV